MTMMFTLPKVADTPQGNARHGHYERARHTREWRDAARRSAKTLIGAMAGYRPTTPVTVTVTHERDDRRLADPDNVSSIAKPIIDGCVDAGLLRGDDWRHVDEVRLRIVPGCPSERWVVELDERGA